MVRPEDRTTAARLDLIEAMLIEVLRRAVAPEAIPSVAARIAAHAPGTDQVDIVRLLGAHSPDSEAAP
jgi:hypothetical protein